MIVRVSVALRRTVWDDIDCRFDLTWAEAKSSSESSELWIVNSLQPGCSPGWMTDTMSNIVTSSTSQVNNQRHNICWRFTINLILMMTFAQVVENLVNVITNSPSQDYTHPDDHTSATCSINSLVQDHTHLSSLLVGEIQPVASVSRIWPSWLWYLAQACITFSTRSG